LNCVSPAVSEMKRDDWYVTSMNTNNAETMHAYSKRSGSRQTLVTAIQKSQQLHSTHFDRCNIIIRTGISQKYGNTSALGRATKTSNIILLQHGNAKSKILRLDK
jgi:protein-tyrosine-phosphatase